MSRTHYQIYQEQTFVLAKTLIVKHEEIASSMNEELYNRGYVVDSNPYNWRYYLNLSGEYHDADKDELYEEYGSEYIMIKLPSDNGPIEVPLTKDLLHGSNADKAMMNEYQIGSKFYSELVSRYPNFETLIIGILNPIERDVSLRADNGEILFIAGRYKKIQGDRRWFDTTWYSVNEVLIEPQEDNLIFELQLYINNFLRHWNNPDYVVGNDLYAVTMLGILYCNIPIAISNIRLGNCKTVKAHTFHIRQYLESHGQIGRYVDFLPIASSLWLYRNATYLEANTGKQLTFDTIMDNLLTPNEIPMSAYSVRHELSNMSDDKLLPTGMLYKEVLNFEVVGASDDDRTVRDILNDQIGLARDNHLDLDEKTNRIQDMIDWGGDDRLNSKVLESEMLELGEPYPFTLDQFLFNIWGYSALRGYYTGTAYATNPLTGDRISFNAKNAYITAMYCLNKSLAGITLDTIPSPMIYNIPKTNLPENLPKSPMFELKPSTDKIMGWCVSNKTRRLKVLEVVGTFIPSYYAQDSETFFNNVQDVYYERIRKYNTYCDVEDVEERGDLELVAKRLYWNGFKQETPNLSYTNWFRTVGFDPNEFNDDDLLNIGLELVASATGTTNLDTINKRWLQKSLLAIMRHFISYSVHIIEKFADGQVTYLEGQTLRFSNFIFDYVGGLPVKYNLSNDYNAATKISQSVHLDISNVFESTKVDVKTAVSATMDVGGFEFGQTSHIVHAGVYSLGTEIMNIEFNTEKAPPVFITIADKLVNTILVANTNAIIRDSSMLFKLPTAVMGISLNNVSMLARDMFITAYGRDHEKNVTTTINVNGKIVDPSVTDDRRIDVTATSNAGISASVNDNSIYISNFIDAMSMSTGNVKGNYVDDYTGFNRYRGDNDTLGLSHINASVSDNSLKFLFIDEHKVIAKDMMVDILDPQIPSVVAPSESMTAVIGSISGSNTYAVVDYTLADASGMSLYGIDVKSSEEYITVDMPIDTHGIVVGGIDVTVAEDNLIRPTVELGNAINTGNVIIDVSDASTTTNVVDNVSVDVGIVTGNIVDEVKSIGMSDNAISADNITASVADASINIDAAIDNNAVQVNNIEISNVDMSNVINSSDINGMSITSISLNSVDDTPARTTRQDDNSIVVYGMSVEIDEESVEENYADESAVMINKVTLSDNNELDEITHLDNAGLSLTRNMISVDIADTDESANHYDADTITIDSQAITIFSIDGDDSDIVTRRLADDHSVDLNVNEIKVTTSDEDAVYSLTVENHGIWLNINKIGIDINDEISEVINLGNVDDNNIDVSDVTLDITEFVSVAAFADRNSVEIDNNITLNINDLVITNFSYDDSNIVTNNMILTLNDNADSINLIDQSKVNVTDVNIAEADLIITDNDRVNNESVIINTSNITVSITDESDDSNINPQE